MRLTNSAESGTNGATVTAAAPAPTHTYQVLSASADNTTLTQSVTVATGDILVVKLCTWWTADGMSAPTGGGLTWQQVGVAAPGGFYGWTGLWVGTATSSATFTISAAPATANNTRHSMFIEQYPASSATLAGSPATNATTNGPGTANTAETTLTTVASGSVISWAQVDEDSHDPTGRVYVPAGAVETGIYDGHAGSNSVHYSAYAPAGAAGAVTFGMSAPDPQKWTMVGVEIQSTGGGGTGAWDTVAIGANTTLTYDNTTAAHGSLSYQQVCSSGSAGGYLAWQTSLGTSYPVLFFRLYVNLSANPGSDTLLLQALGGSASVRASLSITSTGALRWKDAAGATIQTTTNTLTAGSWARIEGYVAGHATAGSVQTLLYSTADSTTATESQSSAGTQSTGGTINEVRFGNATGVVATYNVDDLGVTDTGYLGPASLTYASQVPSATDTGYLSASAARSVARCAPDTKTLTCTVRTSWTGQVPMTGQLWPRGRKT